MTGAGASKLAFVKADGFLSIPSSPTYYLPGRNPTIENLSLNNTLQRLREPGNAEAVDSLAGNLDGAFSVSYAMSADTHQHVRDIVFNDAGTGFVFGRAALSRWYVGAEYLTSASTATAERVLKGCIPLEYSITYQQGSNTITESLTMGYATEERNTSITPGTITGPTNGSEVPFHGLALDIDGTTVEKLQSATITFSNLSRFHRGNDRIAVDATAAAPTTSLQTEAILSGTSHQELAYGTGTAAGTVGNVITSAPAQAKFYNGGTNFVTYDLGQATPENYDWADVVAGDADLTEPITWQCNGGVSIS